MRYRLLAELAHADDQTTDASKAWSDDRQAPRGRTTTRIEGATIRQGEGMALDGHRLVVADFHGLSIVDLTDDAGRATAVTPVRDPAFNGAFSVARVADRYVAVNSSTGDGQPYVLVSVPVAR